MFDRVGPVHGGCHALKRTTTARLVAVRGLSLALAAQQTPGLIESEPSIIRCLCMTVSWPRQATGAMLEYVRN